MRSRFLIDNAPSIAVVCVSAIALCIGWNLFTGRLTDRGDRARAASGEVARIWTTDEVPLWGVVRVVRRRQEIELVRHGRAGARSFFPPLHGNGSERANE